MKKTLTKLEISQINLHKKAYDKARYDFLKWADVKNKKEYMTGMINLLKKQEKLSKKDAAKKAEKIWHFYVEREACKNIFRLKGNIRQ